MRCSGTAVILPRLGAPSAPRGHRRAGSHACEGEGQDPLLPPGPDRLPPEHLTKPASWGSRHGQRVAMGQRLLGVP
jgi:hypothetical protein